jgi:glycosyltransferase involved in cell wall biosynthesis
VPGVRGLHYESIVPSLPAERLKRAVRRPLLYVLHSGYLYGTERMALATVAGLTDEFDPVVFAPPGDALRRAEAMGFGVRPFRSSRELLAAIWPFLLRNDSLVFVATGVKHSTALMALNTFYRRNVTHVHMVHGGAPGKGAYGRKKWLNHFGVKFVAVSDFARQQLIQNGVRPDKVRVVNNFLPLERIVSASRRPAFTAAGVRNVLVISRLDPLKRVGLLLDALDLEPGLRRLEFRIIGVGPELALLRERAMAVHPNVAFEGFRDDVAADIARSDLLLHTCPVETFGLVVLEAMAGDVPVLVPDAGGTDIVVEEGVSGFKFRANDAAHLAQRLLELSDAPAAVLRRAVAGGRRVVRHRFAAPDALREYRRMFRGH